MEGCVIAAVLLNALHKSGQGHMKKWVWFGVILGCASFLIVGAVCLVIFYSVGKAMPSQGKAAFEGVLALLACAILTKISFKFLRLKDLIMKWEEKLVQDKSNSDDVETQINPKGLWGAFISCIADFRDALNIRHQAIDKDAQGELSWKVIVLITFSAMFREGLETVIFLLPISSFTSEAGLTTGAIVGILVGIAFGILVLVVGKYFLLDPSWFFTATTIFIFFIAAGLSTYSVIELEQIGAQELRSINHPVLYRPLYNIGCLHESQGRIWRGVIDTHCFLPENTGMQIGATITCGLTCAANCVHPCFVRFPTDRLIVCGRIRRIREATGEQCGARFPRTARLPGDSDLEHVSCILPVLDGRVLSHHAALQEGHFCF